MSATQRLDAAWYPEFEGEWDARAFRQRVLKVIGPETRMLETGVVSLVGTDPDLMTQEVFRLLDDPAYYASRARPVFPYGVATAAQQIAGLRLKYDETLGVT